MKLCLFSLLTLAPLLLAGPFGTEQLLPSVPASTEWLEGDQTITQVLTARVDTGTTADIIGLATANDQVFWIDSSTPSPLANLITENLKGPSAACSVDADLDGDIDLIVASRWETKLVLFSNDGTGTFDSGITIASGIDTATSLISAQVDGLGGSDIVGISDYDKEVFWLTNNGDGTFGTKQVITSTQGIPIQLESSDFDGNGTQDLAVLDSGSGDILILNNDGSGNFSELVKLGVGMTSFTLTEFTGGRPDVIAISETLGDLVLFENNQSGGFNLPKTLNSASLGMNLVGAVKLDSDDDIDLVLSSFISNQISWMSQLDNQLLSESKSIFIQEYGPLAHTLADLDNDGSVELVHSSQHGTSLHLHQGLAADPYAFWLDDYQLEQQSNPVLGDINENGVSNLQEYAFNLSPSSGSIIHLKPATGTTGLPSTVYNSPTQNVAIEFVRRKLESNSGLTYTVLLSQNLTDWNPADLTAAAITSIDETWERVRYTPSVTPNGSQFLRIETSYTAP